MDPFAALSGGHFSRAPWFDAAPCPAAEVETRRVSNPEEEIGLPGGKTLRVRIVRSAVVLTAAVTTIVAVTACAVLYQSGMRQAEENGRTIAALLASEIGPLLAAGARDQVRARIAVPFQSDDVLYVGVVTRERESYARMGDPPASPVPASIADAPTSERIAHRIEIRAPITDGLDKTPLGEVQLALSPVRLYSQLARMRSLLAAEAVALIAAAFFVGRSRARRLTAPLLDLLRGIRSLRDTDSTAPLPVRCRDEVGLLTESVNDLTSRVQEWGRQAARQNQALELAVRERTEELRRKNQALAVQNEQIMEVSRLKSDFLANMSHELRTPLNAILALSELLRDEVCGPLANDEQKRQVNMIRQSGEGLLRLINDVLDLSRIEAGRMEIRYARTNVSAVLLAAVEEMRQLAINKDLDLRSDVAQGPELWVDPDRIRQVLLNLLSNAVKFTDRGQVRVVARIDPGAERVTIEVADSGAGIAPSDHERVFQEFRQVDSSATRRHGGTGLGLAISRRLVRLMGGEIRLSSDLGQGSVFTFWVPAYRECPEQEASAPAAAAEDRAGKALPEPLSVPPAGPVVLAVDDDPSDLSALQSRLSLEGIDVRTAASGPAALELLQASQADVVVLDLLLPGFSGFEVLEKMPLRGGRRPAVLVYTAKNLTRADWDTLEGRVDRIVYKGGSGLGFVVDEIRRLMDEQKPVCDEVNDARDAA